MFINALSLLAYLASCLLICASRGLHERFSAALGHRANGPPPQLLPLSSVFSNTNRAKNPLVAATYYFGNNGAPQLTGRQESLFSDDSGATSHENEIYESDVCTAPDGRYGTCYDASECVNRGGMPMGRCSSNGYGSNGAVAKSAGSVCCLFEATCGETVAERFVYFRNPGYPEPYDKSRMCRTKIGKINKDICQFRVDLLKFDLARPLEGNCSSDIFVVSGQNENHIMPKICGLNSGQHYYIGVDESGVISFHMMLLGSFERTFDILITQIPCQAEAAAPPHCLQHYSGTHGVIKSFNYDEEDAPSDKREGYPNDLDYMICIRKESGFCSITYELSSDADGILPFAIGSSVAESSHAAIVAQCADDYIVIGGMRLCSGKIGSGSSHSLSDPFSSFSGPNGEIGNETGVVPLGRHAILSYVSGLNNVIIDPTVNVNGQSSAVITDSTPGPFLIRFVSNHVKNARGFSLNYRQNPCK